jgi:hypothetical protein
MLKLYSKALKAKTVQEIDSIAQQIHGHLLSTHRSLFERNYTHFSSTLIQSVINQYTVNYWVGGVDHTISSEGFLIYVLASTVFLIFNETNEDREFFMMSLSLYVFSKPSFIDMTIKSFPYVGKHARTAKTVAISMAQVLWNQRMFKSVTHSALDTISRHVTVAAVNFLYIFMRRKTKKWPFYIRLPLNFAMSLVFGRANEKVSTIGVKQFLTNEVYSVANFFIKEKKTEKLPISVEIPDSLRCEICHDLLVAPRTVESHYFVCKECIDDWLQYSNMNPKSGLPLNKGEIKRNVPMEVLIKKFYDIATNQDQ